jgi:drug/metabolite transporter (DMT)-like permease
MMGLRYLDVSVYQLLRGSGIIFVALMKQHVFHDHMYTFQWIGVFWNVVSVLIVGYTAMLNEYGDETGNAVQAMLGVSLVIAGAFLQSLQFVFEEKAMSLDDSAAPPLLLVGMEGLWGTVLTLFVVYPLVYYIPGDDHGSYENPFNTWHMIANSTNIQWAFFVYFFAIFGYNLFAILVTYALNSIWHAILDNFRPITVWGTDLFIFYAISKSFGEPWTVWSWLQVLGMAILLYGTAVYNAPNRGSVRLEGNWYDFGIDMRSEYEAVEKEINEMEQDEEWQIRAKEFKSRRPSSLMRSPAFSLHTQALTGFGATRM